MHKSESLIGTQLLHWGDRPFTEGNLKRLKVIWSLELSQRLLILCPKDHVFDVLEFKGKEMQISYRRTDA